MSNRKEDHEMGLSRSSMKKLASPHRKRLQARQAAQAQAQVMGWGGLKKLKKLAKKAAPKVLSPIPGVDPRDLLKAAKGNKRALLNVAAPGTQYIMGFGLPKKLKKGLKGLNKVVKTVGPMVATVYPPAAPAIAAATSVLNMAEKGDPKAIAKIVANEALARSGNPEAQQAVALLQTAKAMKQNVKAVAMLEAADKGDPKAKMAIAKIKKDSESNPSAATALEALQSAQQGRKMIAAKEEGEQDKRGEAVALLNRAAALLKE